MVVSFFRFECSWLGSHIYDIEENDYSHEIDLFGQSIKWLDGRQYSSNELEPHRLVGDDEMDTILELNAHDKSVSGRNANTIAACQTIYETYNHNHNENNKEKHDDKKPIKLDHTYFSRKEEQVMYEFFQRYHDFVPCWVDWEQIQRGMDVFMTFLPVAGQALFYLSLVPGFSIPKITKVLQQTKYLAPPSTTDQVQRRLFDTGAFVTHAMTNPENDILAASTLRPGGKGWNMALQVRVLHAKVRHYILRSNSNWDVQEYGIPINQEDMSATLLAFSINVLTGIEFVAGQPLSINEQKDYLALWRYIGWLLGVETSTDDKWKNHSNHTQQQQQQQQRIPVDPCGIRVVSSSNDSYKNDDSKETIIHARASLESFILHLMKPNESSCKVARHLLSMGGDTKNLKYYYRSYMCRRYIGDPLADALKLPKVEKNRNVESLLAYILTYIILMVMRIYTRLTIRSTWFREKAYQRHLRLLKRFNQLWMDNPHKGVSSKQEQKEQHKDDNKTCKEQPIIVKNENNEANDLSRSSCPFALLMPPSNDPLLSKEKHE